MKKIINSRMSLFFGLLFGLVPIFGFAEGSWPLLTEAEWSSMSIEQLQYYLDDYSVSAVDNRQRTALSYAAQYASDPDLLDYLIDRGADVDATTKSEITPLFWSVLNKNTSMMIRLLDRGANLWHRDAAGRQVHMIAAHYSDNPDYLRLLLSMGLHVSERDFFGKTPLMHAVAMNSNVEMAELLIKYGADVHVVDDAKNPPLLWAARNAKNPNIIRLLLEYGADILQKFDQGKSILHIAAVNPNPGIVDALLEGNITVDVRDDNGQTPLMLASGFNENAEVGLVLIEHGAERFALSTSGKSPSNFLEGNAKIRNSQYYLQLQNSLNSR